MRSLSAFLRADHTFWWGERRHKAQPTVRGGKDGSIVVTEKTKTEARVSVSVVHNRRKGKKDAWFNEGKVKRGEPPGAFGSRRQSAFSGVGLGPYYPDFPVLGWGFTLGTEYYTAAFHK